MILKRIYDHEAPHEKRSIRTDICTGCDRGKVVNAARDGVADCPVCNGTGSIEVTVPPVSGVRVLRAGKVQRFTQNFLNGGLKEGWLSMGDGRITIADLSAPLTYQIVRVPGAYCCHCDEPVPGGQSPATAAESLEHVSQAHPGITSPDPSNPSGYRVENCYTAVLEDGDAIDSAEAAAMEGQVRLALAEKLRTKYGAVARRDGGPTVDEGS